MTLVERLNTYCALWSNSREGELAFQEAATELERLQLEIERLKGCNFIKWSAEKELLTSRLHVLQEALEFYAIRLNHQRNYDEDRGSSSTVEEDDGIIARQALATLESKGEKT